MKDFIAKKGIGFYLLALEVVFALIEIIAYLIAGTDAFGLEPLVIVFLVFTILSGILFGYKDFYGIGTILTAIFGAMAFAFLFNARFMYFSHIFYGISTEALSGAMVVTAISGIAILVLGIISAFLKQEK